MLQAAPFTIGVVSDTHVPDRIDRLHPDLLPALKQHNVQAIFHAGDISTPRVLDELGVIAPVTAVRGNRDWLLRGKLPTQQSITIHRVQIALLHGHINFTKYLKDKFYHLTIGYRLEHYLPRLIAACPAARVIVFGHTHQPVTLEHQGCLLFNPGSCTTKSLKDPHPHFGILTIHPDGRIQTETLPLTGYRLGARHWIKMEES